ncbi:germ cell nuclear acidic protein-like [Neocloeon triangulifer]|uniref:germ cell nuclear acidic protein-like n=1 Tax=Neocloeon triangulifer TaxID=2078957 RepID=UPI00286FA358|nr:germ cell nuclear acidic protein-like [Neocloeon triangulifer]
MEPDLEAAAKLFTPPVRRRKKKKRSEKEEPGILSLKRQTQRIREPKNPFMSSDESEEPVVNNRDLNEWFTEDEDGPPGPVINRPKSTATSKTSNTYVTCLTEVQQVVVQQTERFEISEDDDDIAVLSHQFQDAEITDDEDEPEVTVVATKVLSPANTSKLQEVTSNEKVHTWLREIVPAGHTSRKLEMIPSDAPSEPGSQGSTGYPITLASQNRSSFCATSRQESSPESLSHSFSTVPKQSFGPTVQSQASSTSRSSSFYFKTGPSNRKPQSQKKLSNRSTLTIWSDAKSTLESIHLHVDTLNEDEDEENSFSAFLPVERNYSLPKRKSSTSAGSDSLPDTVLKDSFVFASSNNFRLHPEPLANVTNFNPVHSSTHRDSDFQFSSNDTLYKDTLNQTRQKARSLEKVNEEQPERKHRQSQVIILSSDEEYNAEYDEDDVISESSDEGINLTQREKAPKIMPVVRIPDTDEESCSPEQQPRSDLVVPETEDENEAEEPSDQSTHFAEESQEESSHAVQEETPNVNSRQRRRKPRDDFDNEKPSPQRAVTKVVSPTVFRRRELSEESEDDEELLGKFFKKLKEKTIPKTPIKEVLQDDSFIVPDDVVHVESDLSENEQEISIFDPSIYRKLINERRKADTGIDVSIKEANWNVVRKQFTQTPTNEGRKKNFATPGKISHKEKQEPVKRTLSFLASLSCVDKTSCHPDALPYLKNFKSTKDDLVDTLFALFNKTVFDKKLDPNMSITWNNRLRSTAGYCYNQRKKVDNGTTRISRIELSGKILQNPGQLRDTLVHEMCHAATWVIDDTLGGHGPVWKKWTRRAMRVHPELPEIKRCHGYTVETTYTYKCTVCYYSFGRFSKSLDLERKVCGMCRGKFELIVNNAKGKSGTPRPLNKFACFVKENYSVVKQQNMKHKDVMQQLGKMFKETKLQSNNASEDKD